jgi:hypothetical protein
MEIMHYGDGLVAHSGDFVQKKVTSSLTIFVVRKALK